MANDKPVTARPVFGKHFVPEAGILLKGVYLGILSGGDALPELRLFPETAVPEWEVSRNRQKYLFLLYPYQLF
ncbi:hypothetical protein D0T53_07400 [Dysgonomonas sp. 216]|uniref:hypothetical protein n=1 Tax=Dysgonomonas sp. 216 TaxID=2302934 RepID=UPI001C88D107|nr:hypothetical protein [Dysgonomonas sp. 216]NDW18738.1 hypothetical protein [Dysgonomonas sp. 216]